MSDLIRREDVDKAIQNICDLCGEDKKNNGVMCGACNLDSFIREYEDVPSAEPERKWIPVTEALPKDGSLVIACSPYGGITIVNFMKGISQEDRTKMKNGEIDDPSEETWCLSEGYSKSKRSDLFKEEDEWGNNQKAYAWQYGPFHYSGQNFVAWMPLPEPYRGE